MLIITDPMNKKSLQRLMRAKIEELDQQPEALDSISEELEADQKAEFSLQELSDLRSGIHPQDQEEKKVQKKENLSVPKKDP